MKSSEGLRSVCNKKKNTNQRNKQTNQQKEGGEGLCTQKTKSDAILSEDSPAGIYIPA